MPDSILQDTDDAVIDKLQLREGELLKRAAILLLHPAPQRFVVDAYVKIGYFRGSDFLFPKICEALEEALDEKMKEREKQERGTPGFS